MEETKNNIFQKLSKIFLYLSVFLLPLFFLPWSQEVLDFPKQILLLVFILIIVFLQILHFLQERKIVINFHLFHYFLFLFLLFLLLSTLFSPAKRESFFGYPLPTAQSSLSLILFCLFYWFVVNLFKKEETFYLLLTFSLSLFLVVVLALLQLFGKLVLPFPSLQSPYFNSVGSPSTLSLLSAISFPLLLFLFVLSKKLLKIIFLLEVVTLLFFLFLTDFKLSWLIILFSSAVSLSFLASKREDSPTFLFGFLLILLSFSTVFLFFRSPLPKKFFPDDIFLDKKSSWEVALQSLKENPLLGTGPATFLYNFSKNKGINLNQTDLWNLRFSSAFSQFFEIMSTSGLLGTISFSLLLFFSFVQGISFLLKEDRERKEKLFLLAIFLAILNFVLTSFLYSFNFVLFFAFFLFLAIFWRFFSRPKEISEKTTLFFFLNNILFVFLFTFLSLTFLFSLQRCLAEVHYYKAVQSWQAGKLEETISSLQKAIEINPQMDFYYRDLAQSYLLKTLQKIQNNDFNVTEEVYLALDNAKKATEINKINVANWTVRASIYHNLIGVVGGAEDWAIKNWEESIQLEPANPYYYNQKGIVFLRKALLSQNEEEKNQFFAQAEENFKKAIELKTDYAAAHFQLAILWQTQGRLEEAIGKLEETKNLAPLDAGLHFQLGVAYYQKKDYQKAKEELEQTIILSPNYANALYVLGLVYDELGEKEKAIEKFKKVLELNPEVEEVKKIISNLESGKRALENISSSSLPEEKPSEIKK